MRLPIIFTSIKSFQNQLTYLFKLRSWLVSALGQISEFCKQTASFARHCTNGFVNHTVCHLYNKWTYYFIVIKQHQQIKYNNFQITFWR